MESTLKRYFGYSQFRPYQKEIIEMVLDGRDCLAVMATGSGKSLCYQIPPLVKKKTAVVISPLLSLMQDQVMSLNQRGIKADYLGSTQKDSTVQCNAESGRFDILYMTPEKACSISPRKEYKQLDALREHLVDVPFIGLTATATEKVRQDILRSLKMTDPYIAVGSFDRNNLFYGGKSFARGMAFVDELVNEISKAGLYHGQMGSKAREESHRSFIRDDLHVMVATIAFGMGIDKPNIRCVIHFGCPKSLESYYQGSGRCGRDGLASICRLYYTRSDFAKADFYCAEADTAEVKLYHMLLEMRMNLAKNTGTAPYAICGDQTIKKITKIRPSTKVRLANIDGVNQVSYVHIRAFLTMQDLGISTRDNLDPQPSNPALSASQTNTNLHSPPLTACSNENPTRKQPRTDESQIEGTPSKKSHVIVEHESSAISPEAATDTAVLEWLTKYDGVDLSTIVEHFNGSKDVVVNLLGSLESEFLIYKKNGLYRVM
ncbi:ATP-dependent DNA helicase Q-like 3 [Acorus calamus]|uniref:DNA 3'-5' helicase n=1 Tax=Acorus calamus TaxID=4465 RepID=A0AAV9EGF3_ACOCL|nr:ATP-dependent DNA helicase Q-like 3 [Acorus calamus]